MKRLAFYLRVSTDGQDIDKQRCELLAAAERHDWTIVAEFIDSGISGARGRDKRPAFDRMLDACARREIDMVAAWSVDRLSRSLQDLVAFLGKIRAAGVDLYLHKQALNTSTPAGKAMFQMLGVISELERCIIVARVHGGLNRARNKGKRLGRPSVSVELKEAVAAEREKRLSTEKLARIAADQDTTIQTVRRTAALQELHAAIAAGRAEGLSMRAIAVKVGTSIATVHRALSTATGHRTECNSEIGACGPREQANRTLNQIR